MPLPSPQSGRHMCFTPYVAIPSIFWKDFCILTRESDYFKLKKMESLLIAHDILFHFRRDHESFLKLARK